MKNERSKYLLPEEYWEDDNWATQHYREIVKKYPEQWVAIVNKKVVATGATWAEARNIALRLTGRNEFPVFFTEIKRYSY